LFLALVALFALPLAFRAEVYADAPWSAPLNLSDTPPAVSRYPAIAADGMGNVHVTWIEEAGDEDGTSMIYYTMWNGDTWTTPVDILGGRYLLLPSMAVDRDGFIHLVYISGGRLMYSRAHVEGRPWSAQGWSSPVELVPPLTPGDNVRWPEIHTTSQGAVYILYTQIYASGATEVQILTSPDGGLNWSQPVRISNPGEVASTELANANRLAIDESSGTLYALWGEGKPAPTSTECLRVFFARSEDGGVSWSTPLLLSDPEGALAEALAVIVDSMGQVHVFWRDSERAIIHQWSADSGVTWSLRQSVAAMQDTQRYGGVSAVTDSLGNIHLVYVLDGVRHITWDGSEWSPPELVADLISSESAAVWPRLAISRGHELHGVWYDGFAELGLPDLEERLARGEYEIRYSRRLLDTPVLALQPFRATPAATLPSPAPSPTPVLPAVATMAPSPTPASFVASAPDARSASQRSGWSIAFGIVASGVVIGLVLFVRVFVRREH